VAICRISLIGFASSLLLIAPYQLTAQHFDIQTATIDSLDSDGDGVTVTDDTFEPYLETVARAESKIDRPFQPTASDLLIQQAEEKLHQGRDAYRQRDAEKARKEFDAAIELMLRASDNPSDRLLYETRMEEMVDSIHRLDMAGLGAAVPPSVAPQFEKAPLEDLLLKTLPLDPKIKNKVQDELTETTSGLPLTMNDSVLSYINYFSGKGKRTIMAGLERAGKYRPMIERVLREEGVPVELIHLAQAESGFMPRALSNMGAAGMWQFMKFRGQQYGLNQTPFVDDRLDPEKATRAAARHLKDLYNELGNWYLAIAAYNCGPMCVERAVEKTGYADFFELRARRAIPVETTNYVPIILAMTIMTKNAKEYGLEELNADQPLEYDTVDINATTSLELIGDLTESPISQLLELNPALLNSVAPAGYSLRVPKGSGPGLISAMENILPSQRASWRMHTVMSGDTLASVARRYGATAPSIAEANRLDGTATLSAGDRLLIPAAYHAPASRPVPQTYAARQRTPVKRVATTANTQRVPVHTTAHAAPATSKSVPAHKSSGVIAKATPPAAR
jgi:membrane-bound lytic murein transglycosylase D